jgi:hypothetical protein
VYKRFERWAENGVMQRIFAALQTEGIIAIHVEILAHESAARKARPDAHGALTTEGNSPSGSQKEAGAPSFMWCPQMIRTSLKEENVAPTRKGESR